MKRTSLFLLALLTAATGASQTRGRFETYDFGTFRLHAYYTNDVMADVSYIVEGPQTAVTMEPPLFKENAAEFDAYLAALGKPVEREIADYHVSSMGDRPVVMAEGMHGFSRGERYGGMMRHFARTFGDAMVRIPEIDPEEASFDSAYRWAQVTFRFLHGASSDFPAASILIGDKVYYTHWAPVRTHMSHLQLSSRAAVEAEKTEAERSLRSEAELFIGGHGGAATAEEVAFRIAYLQRIERLLSEHDTAEAFAEALRRSFPDLPGEEEVAQLAETLYR